jgi:hypothetical protein
MSIFDKLRNSSVTRDEYEQALQHVRAQALNQQQVMNTAQNYASGGYQSEWNDPRGMKAASSTPSIEELYENVKRNNIVAKELMNKMDRTEKKVEMLTGFYTWITEVYPEIAAQHKAMRDLYEAANPTQTEAGP